MSTLARMMMVIGMLMAPAGVSGAWVQSPASGPVSTTDLFDVSQGITVYDFGAILNFLSLGPALELSPTSNAGDAFGASLSGQVSTFNDGPNAGGLLLELPAATLINQIRITLQADANADRRAGYVSVHGVFGLGERLLLFEDTAVAGDYINTVFGNFYDFQWYNPTPVNYESYIFSFANFSTNSGQGARVLEIDAHYLIPEPASLAMVMMAGIMLTRRHRCLAMSK